MSCVRRYPGRQISQSRASLKDFARHRVHRSEEHRHRGEPDHIKLSSTDGALPRLLPTGAWALCDFFFRV